MTRLARSARCATSPAARCSANGSFSCAAWPPTIGETLTKSRPTGTGSTPTRKAFPIAQRLLRHHGRPTGRTPDGAERSKRMEKLAFGEPVLDRLRQLSGLAASQEWDKVHSRCSARCGISLRPHRSQAGRAAYRRPDRLGDQGGGRPRFERRGTPGRRFHHGRPNHWRSTPTGTGSGRSSGTGRRATPMNRYDYWTKYVDDLKTVAVFNAVGASAGPGDGLEPHGRAASRPGRRSRRA